MYLGGQAELDHPTGNRAGTAFGQPSWYAATMPVFLTDRIPYEGGQAFPLFRMTDGDTVDFVSICSDCPQSRRYEAG